MILFKIIITQSILQLVKPVSVQLCNLDSGNAAARRCFNIQNKVRDRIEAKFFKQPLILNPYKPGDTVLIASYLDPNLSPLERFKIKKKYNKVSVKKWTNEEYLISSVEKDHANPIIIYYRLVDRSGFPVNRQFLPISVSC